VVVVTSADGGSEVVHSLDGVSFSRTAVPADGDGNRQAVNGVTMSADAVKIRLNIYPPGDTAGGPPAGQRLFVGTPR
jgi:hypothetical protein